MVQLSYRRPLMLNAADPKQRNRAERLERDTARAFQDALRATLQLPAARFVFAHIIERAGVYESVFDHSGSVMNYNEGRRVLGLELRTALELADVDLVNLMDREERDRNEREDRATAAHHTARAQEDPSDQT